MATLIPRKQIEEQQNLSGSLQIGGDLIVTGSSIFSGSIQTDGDFFLGNQLTDRGEITGSVFLTGSLTIDGILETTAPETILAVTSSNTLLAVDTERYAGILAKDFGANVPTLYVSSTDGDDTNDGRSIQFPLRTIKRAAELAQPGYDGRYGFDTGSIFNGYVIKVQAGTYLENNPIILPANTTVWGAGLRITKINAQNPEQDLFYVNSGCYIAEVTMGGLRLFPDQINPERGFAVAFQPGAFITTSPYIQNCSQISNQENSFTELYEDIPPGGGGLYVNGDVIDPDSPLASMVLDAYTQISPNGVGCLVNGRGFIQLVSFFTNFSYYAIRVNNGGHATLNNSNISFGLFGMFASGSRFISGSTGGNIDARDKVRASYSIIVDTLNKGLDDGLPDITVLNTEAGIKVTNELQYFTSEDSSEEAAEEVAADFTLVSNIVESGNSNFPTLLARSSTKGYGFNSPYNILGAIQTTSSLSASDEDISQISSSFGTILGIFADGTGSFNFTSSATPAIKATELTPIPTTPTTDFITGSVSSSFGTVLNILNNGLDIVRNVVSNNSASIAVTDVVPFTTGISSSLSVRNSVSASFSTVYNILANGTGSSILDIPENHQREFNVRKSNDNTKYVFELTGSGDVENANLTLYRGETYKFFVSAGLGPAAEPFFIRPTQTSGFDKEDILNYNIGVINNGDSNGTITFDIPYNAPNTLYYISQDTPSFTGKFNIVNNSATPRQLIASTLTYPATIASSSIASDDVDKINAYDLLIENLDFIKAETIEFLSASWADFDYNQETCKRDIGFIVNGVVKDLLFGGNEESIRSGLFYYEYPSEATTTQLGPTLTAVKYVSEMASTILQNKEFVEPNMERDEAATAIFQNKDFVKAEVISFLSSSWSEFYYNESSCSRDVGHILNAVATDLRYEGNARAIEAGQYYYLYPSEATSSQLTQTSDGVRFAAGLTQNIILSKTFTEPSASTLAAYNNLRNNKQLIQNETIEFVNVTYPNLEYNQEKCRRDVGFIIDAVATDLFYSANERSVTAGRFYYDYPSIATTTQKRETAGGIQYAKIISEFIVRNIILDTPRIITNDERLIKVVDGNNNITSSVSGTDVESANISSSFAIIEGIIKRGSSAIPSLIAQNTDLNWGVSTPLNVSTTSQITNSFVNPEEIQIIQNNWGIITSIIADGIGVTPTFTSSVDSLVKVTDGVQISGSLVNDSITGSISSSFSYVANIVSGGLDELVEFLPNTQNNIKVTSTAFVSGDGGDNSIGSSFSSSIQSIVDVITNGLSSLQPLTSSLENNIKVGSVQQYISLSASGSLEDVTSISQSISLVTQIIERGESAVVSKTPYTTPSTNESVLAAYEILKQNIDFIQEETIQYLFSSWTDFEYIESKYRRDVGLIISGAAEDLIWNSNSASIVNGQFYYEFPSEATGSQLQQTLDGINYASRLAQKLIQNIEFQQLTGSALSASILISDNKDFIQDETIQYLSSSWSEFQYDDVKCRRDVGYILDAAITDLKYGGNERSRIAGEYYFLFPSDATGSQLIQTTDGINYASRLAQKIGVGETFTSADSEKVEASRLLKANADLIANEVVEYVSSSWSGVQYDETKCKRDVKYILDAVRTDLVYGGNERTSVAGDFYYRYPSAATVAGVPSSTQQLDPTITGINYANRLAGVIVKSLVLLTPSTSVSEAAELIRENRSLIQDNTIEYVSDTYPSLRYDVGRCRRDTGFIVDAVVTDLVYGGNERSITAGAFYYLFPSQATDSQETETINALNFARDLAKLIVLGSKAVEDSFDNVANIIESGSSAIPTLVENTVAGIKVTDIEQYTTSSVTLSDRTNVSSSFANVINIVLNGTGSIPTIVTNNEAGIKVTDNTQITSSIEVDNYEKIKVGSGFDVVLDIIENGTGSLPTLQANASGSVKRTNSIQTFTTASISTSLIGNTTSSFDIVLDIVNNGIGSTPNLIKNANGLFKVTDTTQYTTEIAVSKSIADAVSSSFDTVINILENGTGSLPTLVDNTQTYRKVSSTPQYILSSFSGSLEDIEFISASISIVTNIIANGVGVAPTIEAYTSSISSSSTLAAYEIIRQNIYFIQDETIAYLSSSWSTASYDEAKCRRDVGLIISGAAEDLIWNADSASIVNGVFYFESASQATGAQLNQTLDGVFYASKLAQKLIQNIEFNEVPSQINTAYDLLVENRLFIQNEVIEYISSSWSTKEYDEVTCKRDVGYIIDAVATDLRYGGNERAYQAGLYYYLYPSAATGSQIRETVSGITYAKNLSDRILRGGVLTKVPHNRKEARELIVTNKSFIQNEVIAYVSAGWNGFEYVEETCKRDVGFILDAVATDLVYGGNERSIEAGEFYYRYPSQATTSQLGPTLSGIRYAKGLAERVLQQSVFLTASLSAQTAYNLLLDNKSFIQSETIAYVSSSWSEFVYNDLSCSRDTGYIVDAVATDILYGGNERVREAGEYYYLYPSLATVVGDGDSEGQLGQTLDGIKYAKGLAQNIVNNVVLEYPTDSQLAGYELLFENKRLLQSESIAFISSSWSGVDGFFYNQAKCARDVGYIVDAVATDLKYGGNQRSSRAGEYYYLYPSLATVSGYATAEAQLDQTITGIRFAAGVSQKLLENELLVIASQAVSSSYELMRLNKQFIQNETIQFIDAFYPYLTYNREKCRRDVGYIVDAVSTDLLYGGNERGIVAGDYYFRFPSKATTSEQVVETVAGIEYAKAVAKAVVQNTLLTAPQLGTNLDNNIKVTETTQYTSSVSATIDEVNTISSSFIIVTDIIENGIENLPTITSNVEDLIKVNDITQITSFVSGSGYEADLVSSSFKLIRDIIYNGSTSIPDSLASNYDYGFQSDEPTPLHITSLTQTLGDGSEDITSLTSSVSSSYGNVKNIVTNGIGSIPTLIENTSGSLKVTETQIYSSSFSGSINEIEKVGNLFGLVLNIIENGTSVIPNLLPNNTASIKVTDTPQIISGSSADRLQGRLISSSFGLVIDTLLNNGTSSITYKAPNATPNTNPKITAAYNLLLDNKEFIQNETIAFMSSSWSGFEYTQSLCERDLGLIISGAAFDLLYGGNSASFVNGRFYFDYPSEATSSQLDQTITALRFAGGLAEKVVRNTKLTHISASLETSASFEMLKANKEFIKNESIAYISSSWADFGYNETTCKRDIGYIIDAVATDLVYGGNERSIIAGDYYYRFPSTATTSQLEPTLTGVRYAKGISMNIVSGSTFQTASSKIDYAYNIIKDNKLFIQSESVAFVNAKFPHLVYDEDKCKRDVGYIVDAVITDLKWGGNERANKAGEFYYLFPSEATGTQVEETTAAVNYARLVTEQIMLNNLILEPQPILNTSASIKVTNVPQYITGLEVGTSAEANLISQSISILENILENGTGSIELTLPLPTGSYTTPSTASNVYYAYNLIKENLDFIKAETIAYMSSSWSTFPYNEDSCSRDVGLIVSGAAEDMLFGSLSASLVNAKFYYEYPSQATGSQLQQTLDGIRYAKGITQKVLQNVVFKSPTAEASASYHLLRDNLQFIQSESISFISSSWDGFLYSQSICMRDIGHIVDAVSTDLLYGGNERSVIAGDYYFRYPSTATTLQLDPTATGIEYASDLATKLIQNEVFVIASSDSLTLRQLIRDNRPFIQDETMAYLTASWSTFDYDKVKCRRDVGYIVDAAATDLLYGGNERSVTAGKFYYLYPSLATVAGTTNGQLEETLDGIRYASGVTQKVIQNIEFVTASAEVSASFDLLRKNKPFIQAETIAYVSSSWSGVYYNEASCSRDVGFLIDAAATDLLYGGQQRSVVAGDFYYRFPSRATNAGVPSEQNQLDPTITGVKYAGRLSSKVIQNPTYQSPSASVLVADKLLINNKTFIQKETIAFLSSSWSTLQYNEVSCSRDLGFILDAIRTDLVYGGNERSIEAGSYYYRIPSVAIYESYSANGEVGQKKQTVDGINYARGIAQKIVNKTQLVFPGTRTREAAARLIAAKDELKQRAIGYTNGAFPYLVYNEASCSRDTGLIVDAVVTDLVYGGNERAIEAASSYYNGVYGSAATVINEQRTETLETNRYLRTRVEFIAQGAPLEDFGSLIVATGIDYSYNGSGVTFKALPPNQGGSGVPDPDFEITELGGGRIYFTSGNQDGDFRIGTGLSINQATGTLVGRTFSKSLFSLVTPFSLALEG
jgi:hypothetical protein